MTPGLATRGRAQSRLRGPTKSGREDKPDTKPEDVESWERIPADVY
jgi:hypothetical protein